MHERACEYLHHNLVSLSMLQVNMFLFKLTTDPIGISVLRMFVITKDVLLTVSTYNQEPIQHENINLSMIR